MPLANSPDRLIQWYDAARFGILQPAADGGDGFKLVDAIQQSLIRPSILNHDFRLALDSKYDWPVALFHSLHEDCRITLEIRERMDVFRDVNHCRVSHEISI